MKTVVARTGTWTLQIVKRTDAHRFAVLPKRWIVERTLAWISRPSTPDARLRTTHPHRSRLRQTRDDPHHAQAHRRKAFNVNQDFSEGL